MSFSGSAPAVQALGGGNIDIHGTSITGSLPHIRSGKLRVLGVMDGKRMRNWASSSGRRRTGALPMLQSLSLPKQGQ